jgi:predicted ATP-dependent endonuclease of OLD family
MKDYNVDLPKQLMERLPTIELFSSESAEQPEETVHNMLKSQFKLLIKSGQFAGKLDSIEKDINAELSKHAQQYVKAIKKYVADLDDVLVQPSFDFSGGLSSTQLQLHRNGRQISLLESGAGQRRRITLAIYEARLEELKRAEREVEEQESSELQNLILAFDEPDTHLDYNWQRRIFDTITEFGDLKAVQVVTCTHSLNFIERVPIHQITHFCLDETRNTKCETIQFDSSSGSTEHEVEDLFRYKISEQMGLRNSILLHERCFLIVEGETEMKALPVLFHTAYGTSLQSAGICLLNGESNTGVIQVIKFLHKHKRSVLFLIDEDSSPNKVTRERLNEIGIEENRIYCIGNKEFEDQFTNELWVEVLNELYPCKDGWATDEIEVCKQHSTKAFSKSLSDAMYIKLNIELSKPRTGYELAKKVSRSNIPTDIMTCFEAARQFANPN